MAVGLCGRSPIGPIAIIKVSMHQKLNERVVDLDPQETAEWVEALDQVMDDAGPNRAAYLLERLTERAQGNGAELPIQLNTPYINTIRPEEEVPYPGDRAMERRIKSLVRWNAMAMVVRQNKYDAGIGGHISTYASLATLLEVGFNHFFHAAYGDQPGDLIYFQGHASPGVYSRAFIEGRLSEEQLKNFRHELRDTPGLSSYPHPWLMPDFWSFPTVSMGLGPINAIYQARFMRYLENRGIIPETPRHVWAYLGDGEMDEPESMGSITLASREKLDNLTFVINCNLQRLDGPVRGNGKVIQELEAAFRGAGWNVIKVIWGGDWDPLLAKDGDGVLVNQMNVTPDGQFQTYAVESGKYIRENFFGADNRLRKMVEDYSDDDLRKLSRGGHDYRKLYAAYKAAVEHEGQPTVIIAQTVKGWTLGSDFEARNATHQMKKLNKDELKTFRDRLYMPISDKELEGDLPPYYHPGEDSDEIQYMKERGAALGASLPQRVLRHKPLPAAPDKTYEQLRKGSGKQSVATTMAFVRQLKELMKHKDLGYRFVPIIPDEARTFGMDAMFPTSKIYSPSGQSYDAVDRDMLLSYQESETGQILHEGITEAGAMGSVIAAGTSYATHGEHMIPIYVFYSMFGFQCTGDQIWALADQLGRGFLLGATAGRTTLNGEGLQHEDGHSLLLAATNPACVAYDPAFAYETSHIVREALDRMYGDNAAGLDPNVFYYLTVYNEAYVQPPEPDDLDVEALLRGLYRYAEAPSVNGNGDAPHAQILASGTGMQWALDAQRLLAEDWGVAADVWSATSWNELRRDAIDCEQHNLAHPDAEPRTPFVAQQLAEPAGPIVAVSDWMRAVPDLISRWVPGDWMSLGTDGFGHSDTRPALRRHFRVDGPSITVAVLQSLARRGEYKAEAATEAASKYGMKGPFSPENEG